NVLPVPLQLDENRPLTDLCRDVAKQLQQARRHGRYRSEQLRRDLGLLGGERRLYGPLINVLPFAHQPNFAGLEASVDVLATGPVDDITCTFRGDINHGLTLEVEANPALYGRAEAKAHAERLTAFADAAIATASLHDVTTASPAEVQQVIHDCNATAHSLPPTTLTALLEASLQHRPEAEAVVFADSTLSYAELDRRS